MLKALGLRGHKWGAGRSPECGSRRRASSMLVWGRMEWDTCQPIALYPPRLEASAQEGDRGDHIRTV